MPNTMDSVANYILTSLANRKIDDSKLPTYTMTNVGTVPLFSELLATYEGKKSWLLVTDPTTLRKRVVYIDFTNLDYIYFIAIDIYGVDLDSQCCAQNPVIQIGCDISKTPNIIDYNYCLSGIRTNRTFSILDAEITNAQIDEAIKTLSFTTTTCTPGDYKLPILGCQDKNHIIYSVIGLAVLYFMMKKD